MFISQNKRALEFMKKVTYYSMDEQILRKMLSEENAIDWSTYFLIAGEFRALKIRCLVKSALLFSHDWTSSQLGSFVAVNHCKEK